MYYAIRHDLRTTRFTGRLPANRRLRKSAAVDFPLRRTDRIMPRNSCRKAPEACARLQGTMHGKVNAAVAFLLRIALVSQPVVGESFTRFTRDDNIRFDLVGSNVNLQPQVVSARPILVPVTRKEQRLASIVPASKGCHLFSRSARELAEDMPFDSCKVVKQTCCIECSCTMILFHCTHGLSSWISACICIYTCIEVLKYSAA